MQRDFLRLGAFVATVGSLLLAGGVSAAPSPATGTLSPATPTLTFTGGFDASDPFGASCGAPLSQTCDEYALTAQLPSDYAVNYPNAKITVSLAFQDEDYDLYVYNAAGDEVDSSATSDNPEYAEFAAGFGSKTYNVQVIPFIATGGTYATTITLVPGQSASDTDNDGVPNGDDLCPGTPAGTAVDADGCPLPDSDGDGVADVDDACPGTEAGATVDATGCPVLDSDADGVADDDDDCPGTPAGTDVDAAGCPVVITGDSATCSEPGLSLLTDPSGDSTSKSPGSDLRTLHMQQPPQGGNGDRIEDQLLAFRIGISAGGVPSPATAWFVSFQSPNGVLEGVRMTGDEGGNPVFQAYFVGASGGTPPARDGRFVDGTKPAHALSTFDAAAGVITIVVKATDLGFTAPGQEMKGFNAGVTQTTGGLATAVDDGMPNNNLSRSTKVYALHDNTVCGGSPLKGIQPPPPASGLPPRYQVHVSPADLGNEAGEPSVGFNKFSQHTMFISYTQALRQTYQEDVLPPLLPASCDATWEDKSGLLTTVNSLDPILFTDEATGRTFNSQLSGDNSLMEFTDDDGDTWTVAQAGPPNGGADHQAVATGPYPADHVPPTATWPANGDKRAVYYCSQSVATAFCSRSDDGGLTFGPGFSFKNTECSAGALHGHVKVAPDGTAYVPDSSQCILPLGDSAEHVGTFVSEDAGQTWAFRDVPQSTGGDGSDPSIGIATDGTTYMCYPNADSTVHVAWSSDKGRTWDGGVDIGAELGIKQTRFPHMIAGDGDRAACAFLGTTGARPESPTNDGSSLDFEGVWHGYIATTYDHGASWHLVNVTPGDPIQGWGGVGPDGTNRNLLDFNDLQIDDEGRTYFAFADGCIGGCVKDPASNSFAAKGTIIRQTGGRTLFAKFDDASAISPVARFNVTTPIAPAAACARADTSQRSQVQADVRWNAPDTGGSAITNYKVYRALDQAGPFTLIGDAGTARQFIDTTVKPSVEKYYYQVEAQNALGTAPISNTIELAISAAAADPCKIPGEIISQDAAGDAQGGDDMDILWLGVAEPADYADSIVITMKMANFTAGVPPPSSFYVILFPNFDNLYIALDSDGGPTHFGYGTATPDPAGQGLFIYGEDGTLPESSYAADGTITFIVPRTIFGSPAPGAVIPGFDARARVGNSSANSRDTAGNVDYTVRGSAVCADPGFVIADLVASTTQGKKALTVAFRLTGGQSKGKKLKDYEITFGDELPGAAATTGSFGEAGSVTLEHVYQDTGVYRARLTVTDEADNVSENPAEQTITVLENLPPVAVAGADQIVDEGVDVEIDGSASNDPDGEDLTYLWTQRSGAEVEMSGADSDTLEFTAPDVEADAPMIFRLTVTDAEGLEHFDDVLVLVHNVVPTKPTQPQIGNTNVGALPALSLLALAFAGLMRRRRPGPGQGERKCL